MNDQEEYRLSYSGPPISRWSWWLTCTGLFGPGLSAWSEVGEAVVRADAAEAGLTLVGDPMTTAQPHGRWHVVLVSEAIAVGPDGAGQSIEDSPRDVVDQDGDE